MWKTASEVLVTDLGDELVLLHPGQSQMFSLNAAGRLIWQRLPATSEALAAHLTQTYQLEPEQAAADVATVLHDLAARQLVENA